MLTVVYILCAVMGVLLIVNSVLVITLHRINRKLAKRVPIVPPESLSYSEHSEESPNQPDKP